MEDNFTRDEFEEFLQAEVRNHRMYPKDAVWQQINKKLHGDKKWPGLTIVALAFISASIIISVYFTRQANIFDIKPSIEPISAAPPSKQEDNVLNKLTSSAPFSNDKNNAGTVNISKATTQPVASINVITTNAPSDKSIDKKDLIAGVSKKQESETALTSVQSSNTKKDNQGNIAFDHPNPVEVELENAEIIQNSGSSIAGDKKVTEKNLKIAGQLSSSLQDDNDKNMVDKFLKEQGPNSPSYSSLKRKSKFRFQVYAAPSISYRKLLEDRSILKAGSAGPIGLNYVTDVNNVVRHKPGAGIEVGLSFMYNVSEKFRIKSGFQFNVRQYTIEAYRSSTEVASIALIRNNRLDTVNTIAFYRNNNGYYSAQLVNRYYQLSVPVGVEWEVLGNRKIQLNVAAAIQPTYLLNRNAYLLSTNFKNYTESPDMIRNWNLNSNVEAFISFKSGDFKWQIGPQLRYQPYSTFIPQYPIKEHLLDYGVKLGISKSLR
jgi:hypothetical protein